MIKKILLFLGVLMVVFCAYVALQPPEFTIARETVIQASPDQIFPLINNSQKANEWMPWQASDPGVQINYSGPAEGVGSISSWDSKGQMGTGRAEVIESVPNQVVKTQLSYTRPMNMSQLAIISLSPEGEATRVRWEVNGRNNFLGRLMCTFFNMEKKVGGEFEKGLNNLKNTVEGNKS